MSETEYLHFTDIVKRSAVSEGSCRIVLLGFETLLEWKVVTAQSNYRVGNAVYVKDRPVYAYRLRPRAMAALTTPHRGAYPVRRETNQIPIRAGVE